MNVNNEVPATPSPLPAAISAALTGRRPGKVAIGFINQNSDADLATASGRVLSGLTANAAYPDPSPTLAMLASTRDAFLVAVQANDRGHVAIAARNEARAALAVVLRSLALYVQHTCEGNRVKLLSSGFPVQRTRSPATTAPPAVPAGFKARPGAVSGQVSARCQKVAGARMYQVRYATAQAPTNWIEVAAGSGTGTTINGLAPVTEYLLQVRALGNKGPGNWSDSVTVVVA